MYLLWDSSPDLEFGWPTSISLLCLFDLSFPYRAFPGPGNMALLMVRDVVKGYTVVFLTIVLRIMAG